MSRSSSPSTEKSIEKLTDFTISICKKLVRVALILSISFFAMQNLGVAPISETAAKMIITKLGVIWPAIEPQYDEIRKVQSETAASLYAAFVATVALISIIVAGWVIASYARLKKPLEVDRNPYPTLGMLCTFFRRRRTWLSGISRRRSIWILLFPTRYGGWPYHLGHTGNGHCRHRDYTRTDGVGFLEALTIAGP